MDPQSQPADSQSVPPPQTSSPNRLSTSSKLLLFVAIFSLIAVISVIVGIQIGKNSMPKLSATTVAGDTVRTPTTTTSIPTPFPLTKTDPAKIVEDVRMQMGIDKNSQINPTTFTWNGETVTGRSKEDFEADCTDTTTSIAGYGFIAYDVPQYKEPNLASLGYASAQSSGCNEGNGTIKGQRGYIIDSVLCILSLESKVIDGPHTVEFSCGYPSTVPISTPDITVDWKTYSGKEYTFRYPQDWSLRSEEDDNVIFMANKEASVGIVISDSNYPYGYGPGVVLKEKDLNIVFLGKTIIVKERDGSFVDFSINDPRELNILFGTGYPVASVGDNTKSISDYSASKETILKILSTFKFLEKNTPSPTDTKINN